MPNVDAGAKAWELELAGRIGAAVHVRRKALNLTAQQLAERTKNLGYPITRVAISKIEGNMRTGKIDVADLLVLAAALDLPTISLLFPGAADQDVEALPGRHTSKFTQSPVQRRRRTHLAGREVAELTEKLDRIDRAMTGRAGVVGRGALTFGVKKKEETP